MYDLYGEKEKIQWKLLVLLKVIKAVPHVRKPLIQIYGFFYLCIFCVTKTLSGNQLKYLNSTFSKSKQESELTFEQCIEYKP